MQFSPHSLHPPITLSDAHKNEVRLKVQSFVDDLRKRMLGAVPLAAAVQQVTIPLTTVSLAENFDAYINVQFRGKASGSLTPLIVDSGNSNLIVPSWEAIEGLPGYTVLGEAQEPWGSPAKVVRGPIEIPTTNGGIYSLENVLFLCLHRESAHGELRRRLRHPVVGQRVEHASGSGRHYASTAVVQQPISVCRVQLRGRKQGACFGNGTYRGPGLGADPESDSPGWVFTVRHSP
jgi:hypothetical protein